MDKIMLILGILTAVSIIGVIIFQINVQGSPVLAGLGYVMGTLCVIIVIAIAMIPKFRVED